MHVIKEADIAQIQIHALPYEVVWKNCVDGVRVVTHVANVLVSNEFILGIIIVRIPTDQHDYGSGLSANQEYKYETKTVLKHTHFGRYFESSKCSTIILYELTKKYRYFQT